MLVANAVDRALCVNLSDRFKVVPLETPADLTVFTTITQAKKTNEAAAGLSVATSLGTSFIDTAVPVPIPRIPIGMGSLSIEAEAVDRAGQQQAAILWGKGATMFFGSPRVWKASDAYDLAGKFGDDFASLLIDLPVARTSDGRTVALGQVARQTDSFGPTKIERRDRSRVITVPAAPEGRVLGDAMTDINAGLAKASLPEGITVGVGGDADLMDDTVVSMAVALIMAVIFIYLVLASQFGSFLQPLAIMVSLPLAASGVVLGLIFVGGTLNLYSMIGVVMLMGLVVKNAILLVDNANQQQRAGLPLHEALVEAGLRASGRS